MPLMKQKKRPWDLYRIYTSSNGAQRFNAWNIELYSDPYKRRNDFHFTPFNAYDHKELHDDNQFPVGTPTRTSLFWPPYMLYKGVESLIAAVDNKQIKLFGSKDIEGLTNPVFMRFMKRVGINPGSDFDGMFQVSASFNQVKTAYKNLTNDPLMRPIIKHCNALYLDANKYIGKFLEKFGEDKEKIHDFWKWYFENRKS